MQNEEHEKSRKGKNSMIGTFGHKICTFEEKVKEIWTKSDKKVKLFLTNVLKKEMEESE